MSSEAYYREGLFALAVIAASNACEAASLSVPCDALQHISSTNRKALRQINSPVKERGSAAYRRAYDAAKKVMDTNQWPFSPVEGAPDGFIFKPADFDGDGRIDELSASCGASSWTRLCVLSLDRGAGQPLKLEAGWIYVARVSGDFYVIWDYYGAEGGQHAGLPKRDFSQYYRMTSQGFPEICKTSNK